MTNSSNYPQPLDQQRQRLEVLIQRPGAAPQGSSPVLQRLMTLGGRVISFLTTNQDLRIWQQTRQGRQIWFAYDPITDQKRQFFSEHELRIWLDSRYYD